MNPNRILAAAAGLVVVLAVAGCAGTTSGSGQPITVASTTAPPPTPLSTLLVTPPPTAGLAPTPTVGRATVTMSALPTPTDAVTSQIALGLPSAFIGTWYGHSRSLVIKRDGSVTMSYRLYVNCTAQRTTGCDRISGNTIYDGGTVTAQVSQVIDPNTMVITVSQSSVPKDVPYGPIRIGHDVAHDAVAIFAGGLSGVPFCGPTAPAGYCGA